MLENANILYSHCNAFLEPPKIASLDANSWQFYILVFNKRLNNILLSLLLHSSFEPFHRHD